MSKKRGAACTGGKNQHPVVDRNGKRVHVGDVMRVKHCIGRYGQTAVKTVTVTDEHWPYCEHQGIATRYDFATGRLVCATVNNDFEHGHDTYGEIID